MRKIILILALIMGLAGCNSAKTVQQERQAVRQAEHQAKRTALIKKIEEAEVPPLPKDWKRQVEAGTRAILKDPDSAKFLFTEEVGATELSAGIRKWGRENTDGTTTFGWQIHFGVNAKNSYGGYTGMKPWEAIFVNGRLLKVGGFGQ